MFRAFSVLKECNNLCIVAQRSVLLLFWCRLEVDRSRNCSLTLSLVLRLRWESSVTVAGSILKMIGAWTQHCLTPTSTVKGSNLRSPITTGAFIPVWNCLKIIRNQGGTYSVKRLLWISQGHIEVFITFTWFFPDLLCHKDHVWGAPPSSKATLCLQLGALKVRGAWSFPADRREIPLLLAQIAIDLLSCCTVTWRTSENWGRESRYETGEKFG